MSPTSQRILNDTTWESLAISCRAAGISRGFFATLITGMQRRATDHADMDRIIALYNRIPEDAAERVIRFLQVRISSLEDPAESSEQIEQVAEKPAPPEPVSTGFGRMATG